MTHNIDVLSMIQPEKMMRLMSFLSGSFQEHVRTFVVVLGQDALEIWKSEAKNSVWGEQYASALKMTETGDGVVIEPDSTNANYKFYLMTEEGVRPWSIRDALLNGKAAARNMAMYGTLFVHVPLRQRTPTAGPTKVTSSFAGVMPKNIYQMSKSGQQVSDAGNLTGLKRYGANNHGQYMTFRTVSEKTPKDAWQHPGSAPDPIFSERVEKAVDSYINAAVIKFVDDTLAQMGKVTGG